MPADRPMIGERCYYRGWYAEVRAVYSAPDGLRVVGRYFRPRMAGTHFVSTWQAFQQLPRAV